LGYQQPSPFESIVTLIKGIHMRLGSQPKKWIELEESFIRDNFNILSNKQLADHLGVSIDTVKMKIRKMMKDEGIKRLNFKADFYPIEGEIWKVLKHYPQYEVSSHARFRKIEENGKMFLVQTSYNLQGYVQVAPTCNGIRKTLRLHRLVAEAFIPPIEGKLQVNHIDGDKENNFPNNLEWCTASENIQHAFDTGLNIPPDRRGSGHLNLK